MKICSIEQDISCRSFHEIVIYEIRNGMDSEEHPSPQRTSSRSIPLRVREVGNNYHFLWRSTPSPMIEILSIVMKEVLFSLVIIATMYRTVKGVLP